MAALGVLGRRRGRFGWLPLARGWTDGRDMPAPEGKTFFAAYAQARRQGKV
jgi:L-lactate dehydrogenase complex protein LldF